MQQSTDGFTLIEMLVVLVLVALLLTIALPRYTGSVEKAKEVALVENLRVLRVTLDQFRADKGHYPATLDELVDHGYLRAVPVDPVTESNTSWFLLPAPDAQDSGIGDVRSGAPGMAWSGRPYESL